MISISRDIILDELGKLENDFLNDIDSEDICQCFSEVRQLVYKLGEKARIQRKKEDLDFICTFSKGESFDEEICRDQLRALWTAYCLKYNLDPDTCEYDNDSLIVWNTIEDTEPETADWSDFDSFDLYLSKYLC